MNLPKPKFKEETRRNNNTSNLFLGPKKAAPPPGMSYAVAETIAK